jgi:hypothetical protein
MAVDVLTNVKLLLNISDTKQDDLLNLIIQDSKDRLTGYINQDGMFNTTYPVELDWIVRELTVRRFNRIGDEGKKSSSENDLSNSWIENDISDYAVYLNKYRQKTGGRGIARFL